MLNRFGDVIYTGTQETIEAFEKRNKVSLCKDSIGCGYMTQDDCVAMFSGKVFRYLFKDLVLSDPACFREVNFIVLR
jgi:hypothetical protein